MLKLFFWLLLLANGTLFAYHQGYLNALFPDGREPGRAARQLNTDQIKLLPAGSADSAHAAATQPPAATPAAKPQELVACIEIGNFDAADARRFEERLANLALGDKLSRHAIQDGARHMVFIPSQGNKESADKKAGELRKLGVKDFYVIQEEGAEMRWGISLGIFRTEEAATAHLKALSQKGVRSARLGPYSVPSSKFAFQARDVDAGAKEKLDKIKADFPQQESRNCEPAPSLVGHLATGSA